MTIKKVAFIGTGIMGGPMAVNIAKAGFPTFVWNRSFAKAAQLDHENIIAVHSLTEAFSAADVIVVMLSTGRVVDEVLFTSNKTQPPAISTATKDAVVAVMSSIPVETARRQATKLEEFGLQYIDAPVSGGETGAIEASLTILAGGPRTAIDKTEPILKAMGRVNHLGPVGCGQAAKIANQAIVGITIAAISEAFLLAGAEGVSVEALREALTGGFADSTILQQHGKRIAEENYRPGAYSHIQLKDLNAAQSLALSSKLDLPVVKLVRSLYQDMCDVGMGELDHAGLYEYLKHRVKEKTAS